MPQRIMPARILGIDERQGEIAVGQSADFVVLGGELAVMKTTVDGRVVYGGEA